MEADDSPGVNADTDSDDSDEDDEIPGVDANKLSEDQLDQRYGRRTHQHGLRPRRTPRYVHRHARTTRRQEPESMQPIAPQDYNALHATLEHTVLTQHSIKKGLQVFGQKGADAVITEMKQLHERKVIEPKAAHMLTKEEKRRALHYLMFLKQKRCGRIKGRGCADGRKQRIYKSKEETSSPTVAVESLFISCVIDAKEGRDVITCDIPGAFMQSDMDEVIHMKLEGPLAELLTKVDPKTYLKYMVKENGKSVIYVTLKKALYGTLQAALLFWQSLTETLEEMGFKANPYDQCVMNKIIDGKQCTILWHVDDLKISHVDKAVNEEILRRLNLRYGKEAPLTVTRGKVHDYLGMTIDYSVEGKVMIKMLDYVLEILDEAPVDMNGEAVTPAAEHLFTLNEVDPEKLDEPGSELYHRLVAKLLFLSKRSRPDIQTAVAFLTTRVRGPDTDDYKKLSRVIRYLRESKELYLTLEADDMHVMKWWIDASFAVHKDMKSHTGGTMSMGKGSVYSASTRQKLNTKSSTEAELVGVDDLMPMVLWTRYFTEAQGYEVRDALVHQDNQAAMLLERNGRKSSGKRTRHINIRYFFVCDRIKSGEVSVEYCPTEEMIGDVFTKPLQGSLFRKFRKAVLNIQD